MQRRNGNLRRAARLSRDFLDCCEGSKEAGMVCADGVYELGAIDGTKFLAEAKALGASAK